MARARLLLLIFLLLWAVVDDPLVGALGPRRTLMLDFLRPIHRLSALISLDRVSIALDEALGRNIHGPIGARIPGLRKLVQSHRLTVSGDKHQPDYDGMAELWFDDVEALLAARQSPEWKSSSEDEANFIDHSKVAYFVSEEHTILNESQTAKNRS